MIRIRAHFDGKVIVPDEAVELSPNTALDVLISPANSKTHSIANLRGKGAGLWKSVQEVDDHLRRERDSWDR